MIANLRLLYQRWPACFILMVSLYDNIVIASAVTGSSGSRRVTVNIMAQKNNIIHSKRMPLKPDKRCRYASGLSVKAGER